LLAEAVVEGGDTGGSGEVVISGICRLTI
jgi:hypothetical protein